MGYGRTHNDDTTHNSDSKHEHKHSVYSSFTFHLIEATLLVMVSSETHAAVTTEQ